jgi:FAD/FMN-containing dehydrogenase
VSDILGQPVWATDHDVLLQEQSMTKTVTDPSGLAIGTGLSGTVIRRGDAGYDDARRVWNGMVDRRPAIIVKCTSTADVVAAVNHAREQGLVLAVRGGGHNAGGLAMVDDGLVIDLSPMKAVKVDKEQRIAYVEGGALWRDLDAATHPHGLATTGGLISSTGVGGLTLGGGLGWLMRKHGLACDNVAAVEIVTADGQVRRASATENPDLFWGIRGGGGNFGVVTSFEFRLHPVSTLYAGMLVFPGPRAPEVLRRYRDVAMNASDDLTVFAAMMTSPDGQPITALLTAYNGPVNKAEAAVKPLRDLGPVADQVGEMPYPALQSMLDDGFPSGLHVYWRSDFLKGLPDEAIDALVDRFTAITSPLSALLIEQFGGAVARVPADETAFAQRDALFNLAVIARWADPATATTHIDWARKTSDAVSPFTSGGVYVNYLGAEGADRVRAAYGAKYDRLVAIKQTYDPTNLFSVNQNIQPR